MLFPWFFRLKSSVTKILKIAPTIAITQKKHIKAKVLFFRIATEMSSIKNPIRCPASWTPPLIIAAYIGNVTSLANEMHTGIIGSKIRPARTIRPLVIFILFRGNTPVQIIATTVVPKQTTRKVRRNLLNLSSKTPTTMQEMTPDTINSTPKIEI